MTKEKVQIYFYFVLYIQYIIFFMPIMEVTIREKIHNILSIVEEKFYFTLFFTI